MILKVFLVSILSWVLPIEQVSFVKFISHYFPDLDLSYEIIRQGNTALLISFFIFLFKDIFKLFKDFFRGLYLLIFVKRDLVSVYERHNGFIYIFYLAFLIFIKKYFNTIHFDVLKLSYIYIGLGIFALIPSFLRIIDRRYIINLYMWPVLFFSSLVFVYEGVSVLFFIVIVLRILSVNKEISNKLAFLSLFTIFLTQTSYMDFAFHYMSLIFVIPLVFVLYLINYVLQKRNFLEISVVYILLGVWTILDLFFS